MYKRQDTNHPAPPLEDMAVALESLGMSPGPSPFDEVARIIVEELGKT